ncbi:MAG: N-acetyltransferase [Peptococcaceae bacterium]|nr:N-acetyltransferase [Peptococcaceae bacterium]
MSDIEEVHQLITNYADGGLMLARSRSMLYEGVREITVAEEDGRLVGVGMLHVMWEDLAEIRALAVHPDYKLRGIGRKMIDEFLAEAKELKIPRVFALTYQAGFFVRCGFKKVSKESLPQKMWRECVDCPKFPNCDEEAVQIDLKI